MDNLTRRQLRYICFRIQSEVVDKVAMNREGVLIHAPDVREHMEEQEYFGGWDKFGKTWDVDEKAHFVIVPLKRSLESAWNKVIKKNAKPLPSIK